MNQTMLAAFVSARKVSVPLICIRTADQFWTEERTAKECKPHEALVRWDAADGMSAVNEAGGKAMKGAGLAAQNTMGFIEAMIGVGKLPQTTICYVHNAHRQLQSSEPLAVAGSVQAVSNLRDQLKRNFRCLVLMGPEGFVVPSELSHDVVVLDYPLPSPEELEALTKDVYKSGGVAVPTDPKDTTIAKAVDAISGLTSFEAEQTVAMSFAKKTEKDAPYLDLDRLWERKRVAIEQTPGLSVWRGDERFADIIGQDAIKEKLTARINGKRPLGVVVWIDEIDKALANVEQDTSGVRMYQLLKLLTEMENNRWKGFIGVGVAGGGKSLIAKALGNEAGVPTVALDLGATESKYVGESEANLLRVISIIKAVGRGNAYFVATSNAASVMRPELQRRFSDGMWMFDLMSEEERLAAFSYYRKKYNLTGQQALPKHEMWTGAEIRNCCEDASELGVSLVDAAKTILPMAVSRATAIEELRKLANGAFLDANKGGSYHYDPTPMRPALRAIEIPVEVVARAALDDSLQRN